MIGDEPTDGGLPRAYLRPVLLVLLARGPMHGYELLDQVREAGVRSAETAGLYRTLRSMEQHGLLDSWWEDSSSGPPRRTYVLTETGHKAFHAEMKGIEARVDLLNELLRRAGRTVAPQRRPR